MLMPFLDVFLNISIWLDGFSSSSLTTLEVFLLHNYHVSLFLSLNFARHLAAEVSELPNSHYIVSVLSLPSKWAFLTHISTILKLEPGLLKKSLKITVMRTVPYVIRN